MITALRLCFGVTTVCTLLLYRNYFHSDGVFRAGLAGVGQVVVGLAIGSAAAAALTPAAARRLGYVRWPALLLAAAAVIELGLCLPYSVPLQLLAATGFGFVTQAVKICVDTVVQQAVEDDFRGRVFALYDTLFNVAFVAAATVAAIAIPESGHSPTSVVVLAVAYAVLCVAYARGGRPTFTS